MARFSIVVAFFAVVAVSMAGAQAPDPVKIGLQSLLDEIPDATEASLIKSFEELIRDMTGLTGKAIQGGNAYTLAQDLKEGKLHLGVFQGFELAWAQQKHPKLKPLMIGVYYEQSLRANLLVQKTSGVKKFADLKGKDLAVPLAIGGHARVYLDRLCRETSKSTPSKSTPSKSTPSKSTPSKFFNKVTRPDNSEIALDALCDGEVHCVVVDNVSLETYKSVKAGPFKRLQVLLQSEVFPPSAVVYYEGGLDPETVNRFSTGMLKANKDVKAKEMMSLFKITSFEPIPADYSKRLAGILKVYPAPEAYPTPDPALAPPTKN